MELTSHPAGTFCFPELNTRDMDGAKRFYARLLDWTWFDVPSAAGGYSLIRVEGKDVAGLHRFAIFADTSDAVFAVFQAPSRP